MKFIQSLKYNLCPCDTVHPSNKQKTAVEMCFLEKGVPKK